MTTHATAQPESSLQNDDLRFFGPPPLMPGDDPKAYEALRAAISADMAPQDTLDLMWTRDITDLQWEVLRLRRLKVEIIKKHMRGWLDYEEMMSYRDGDPRSDDEDSTSSEAAEAAWREEKEREAAAHAAMRARYFFPIDIEYDWNEHGALATLVLEVHLDRMSKIDRMIASAETRRNAAYKHAERRRANLGTRLRKAVDAAEATLAPQADNSAEASQADDFAEATLAPQADDGVNARDALDAAEATLMPQTSDSPAAVKEAA